MIVDKPCQNVHPGANVCNLLFHMNLIIITKHNVILHFNYSTGLCQSFKLFQKPLFQKLNSFIG